MSDAVDEARNRWSFECDTGPVTCKEWHKGSNIAKWCDDCLKAELVAQVAKAGEAKGSTADPLNAEREAENDTDKPLPSAPVAKDGE
jgi:hypothetical protein